MGVTLSCNIGTGPKHIVVGSVSGGVHVDDDFAVAMSITFKLIILTSKQAMVALRTRMEY